VSNPEFPIIGDGLDRLKLPNFALTIAEGFCAYGHGPLQRVQLHGHETGACLQCGCSWRAVGGQIYAAACVPGKHTCGVH
jgi:hypothetical protein